MMALEELLARLVAIDSRNPGLSADAPGEAAIAAFVAAQLRDAGLQVEVIERTPGRPSVIGMLRGSGGGRNLLLNAHTDTVGFTAMVDPIAPRIQNGRLYGRGALDMKSGLAAIMVAAAELARGPQLQGDLVVAAVSDEEHASIGTEDAIAYIQANGLRIDGAIIPEPSDMQLYVAHRGFAWLTITTHGRAAHGSRRAEGIDAIVHMGRVIVALEAFDAELQQRPAHSLLEASALHASLITGGSELSTYPAHCELQIERRTLPHETAESVAGEIEAVLEKLRAADPRFKADSQLTFYRPALETPADAPIVATLAEVAERQLGTAPRLLGAPFWMDSALLAEAGIPTAVFGPYGAGLHSDVEWVDLASVQTCAKVLTATARAFCAA